MACWHRDGVGIGGRRFPGDGADLHPEGRRRARQPRQHRVSHQRGGRRQHRGGYNQSRWAEDWRKYCDPAKRDDVIDALKCVKLTEDGKSYVTFSGELRTRVNITTNPNLREVQQQRQDIARIVGGADVHLGDHFRRFRRTGPGELQGINLGAPGGNLATSWPCSSFSPK